MEKLSPTWFAETMTLLAEYLPPDDPQPSLRDKFFPNGFVQVREGLVIVGSRAGVGEVTASGAAFTSEEAIRM